MTAQAPERLLYDSEKYPLAENPLYYYFQISGRRSPFRSPNTALWRGYVGTWEISDERFYIVGLTGHLGDGSMANLSTLFPEHPNRAFAHWYTGQLRVPQGKLLKYVHHGYASIYERDLRFDIKKGVVTGTRVNVNGHADPDAPEGYTIVPSKYFIRIETQLDQTT